jgi:hypothetical protein
MQMSATAAAVMCARLVSKNLEEAISFYESFVPSARDSTLIQRINTAGINAGFNVISDSLHHSAIIALCRIWDKRRDVASLWTMKRRLENPRLIDEINDGPKKIDAAQVAMWSRKVEQAGKSEEVEAIKASRDFWLAHTKAPDHPYSGAARAEVYGDERRVLEMTEPLVIEANALIGYEYVSFTKLRSVWPGEASKFWKAVCSG